MPKIATVFKSTSVEKNQAQEKNSTEVDYLLYSNASRFCLSRQLSDPDSYLVRNQDRHPRLRVRSNLDQERTKKSLEKPRPTTKSIQSSKERTPKFSRVADLHLGWGAEYLNLLVRHDWSF
jgi:hypothetical protein